MSNTQEPLAALEARIRLLEDKEAIRELICSWGPACDTGLPEEAASIWTDDGVLLSDLARLEGPQDVKDMIDSEGQQDLIRHGCAHVHGLPLISVDGDEANAINYSRVYRYTDPGYEIWRVSANEWKFRRTPDGWRATSREAMVIDGGPASKNILKRAYTRSGS
jgi:SnoaL-like domain